MTIRRSLCLVAAIFLCLQCVSGWAQAAVALKVDESATRLTFPRDGFRLALTVVSAGASPSARINAELVDTEDEVLTSGQESCDLSAGTTECAVEMPPAIRRPSSGEANNLPNFRVRYTVFASGVPISGTQSVDRIAPDLFEMHVAAPGEIHRGGSYTARVRALHPLTHLPRAGVALKATLSANFDNSDTPDASIGEQQLVTDADGFVSVPYTVPDKLDLTSIMLHLEGTLANLHPGLNQQLNVPENRRFELTTDKLLYQPGQTVHTRLLLLDRRGHASALKSLRLGVSDPNGILVFRAEAVTSAYGIATVDWAVPARLRLGEYNLKAELIGEEESQQAAFASLRVSRYDLPTFVVVPKPDRAYYLPGKAETAKVEVRANYLFGKPVLKGHVRVVREDERNWNYAEQRYDTKEGKAVSGELGADGSFTAEIPLGEDLKPFAENDNENPYSQIDDLHLAAYVTDVSTGRTEERRFDVRVARRAIQVYVTAANQAAGLPMQYFVAATTADGNPVQCDLSVLLLPEEKDGDTLKQREAGARQVLKVSTDSRGLALFELPEYEALRKMTPQGSAARNPDSVSEEDAAPTLEFVATGRNGETGLVSEHIDKPGAILRVTTNRSIYRPGDPVEIALDSAQAALPVTVQILRHPHRGDLTLATRELTLDHGHAALTVPSDARFTGFVFVQAVVLGTKIRDQEPRYSNDESTSIASRAILFPRDNSLRVGIAMSAESYVPGAEAVATLSVKGPQDPDGEIVTPAPSALGIVAVDQAVAERNRTDSDFGDANAQPFFFRWISEFQQTNAAGGYTIDALERMDNSHPVPEEAQLAAEMLFNSLNLTFDTQQNAPPSDLAGVYRNFLSRQLKDTRSALAAELKAHLELPTKESDIAALLTGQAIDLAALRDPWGVPYKLVATADNQGGMSMCLRSAGPDKVQGTGDDFEAPLANWRWFAARDKQLQQAVNAFHKRTGGFVRNLADLRDEMRVEGVDFDGWRDPWGQRYTYTFEIEQTRYEVQTISNGDPVHKPRFSWEKGPYIEGSASIDYTVELRRRIDQALNRWAENHPYPSDMAAFRAALQAAGIPVPGLPGYPADGLLIDPWHQPLRVTFRTRSFYTDRVHTEAHATPASAPQTRTTIETVTAIADVVELHSVGPDGQWNTPDDFVMASFSRTRSLESARDKGPKPETHSTVQSGATGDIAGAITDQSGAVIANASVIATDAASGDEYEGKSDRDGRYVIGPLPVGQYKVRFSSPGFMDLTYDEVVVLLKNTVTLDVLLRVGAASETVEVSADALSLNTSSASVISAQQISALPLMKIAPGLVGTGATATPRLRDYFPETLLWRPEILTAADGTATVKFPVADSITNWQLSAAASTLEGNTGAGAAEFRSFQPFFAAFDPPSVLTVGDTIALPVTLRNYLDHEVTVRGSIAPAPWFRLDGPRESTAKVASQDSASPVFRFTALSPVAGAKQEFTAQAGDAGDRIAREVTVHPDGQESAETAAAILAPGANTLTLALPQGTLAGSTDTTLKVYPNLAAHIRDAILAMTEYPNGCAEQILSGAWPSLLLQRYAAAIPQKDDAVLRDTHRTLEQAYENLLADQKPSGGFGYWPKDTTADLALTAYAIEFLTQARQFVAIDDRVIDDGVKYLAMQQSTAKETAGLWVRVDREGKAHPEDVHGNMMMTASIAAMIAAAPKAGPVVAKALAAATLFAEEFDEPYTLASYALAAMAVKDATRSAPAIERLRGMALEENGGAYWKLETNTPFFGWGRAGRVETTAQVLRALLAADAGPQDDLIARGLLFLDHQQDRQRLWYSTQATARALDVMAEIAMRTPIETASNPGELQVQVEGQPALRVPLPPLRQDAGPIFVPLGGVLGAGAHAVKLTMPQGSQSATAQLVATFYQTWSATQPDAVANNERLELSVAYSTLKPAAGDAVEVSAHVERVGFRGYGMMIGEIGLPPGADVDRATLESAVTASDWQINHYEVLPDKVLLYLWPRAGGLSLHFRFSLRYGIDALAVPSSVYDYYNPDSRADVAPARFHAL